MTGYEWARKFNADIDGVTLNQQLDVEEAQREIERISDGGNFVPQDIVDASKAKNKKLHKSFEWDDKIGGNKYRCDQARLLVRSINVIHEREDKDPVLTRAYVSVKDPEQKRKRVYMSSSDAMAHQITRDEVLSQALGGLKSMRKRWYAYNELADLITVLDRAVKDLEGVIAKG